LETDEAVAIVITTLEPERISRHANGLPQWIAQREHPQERRIRPPP
jgi:hypothetical protein